MSRFNVRIRDEEEDISDLENDEGADLDDIENMKIEVEKKTVLFDAENLNTFNLSSRPVLL